MILMGRRVNENIRKVQRSSGMYYISIPIEIAREMGIQERQKMVVEYDSRRKRIIIKDWEK